MSPSEVTTGRPSPMMTTGGHDDPHPGGLRGRRDPRRLPKALDELDGVGHPLRPCAGGQDQGGVAGQVPDAHEGTDPVEGEPDVRGPRAIVPGLQLGWRASRGQQEVVVGEDPSQALWRAAGSLSRTNPRRSTHPPMLTCGSEAAVGIGRGLGFSVRGGEPPGEHRQREPLGAWPATPRRRRVRTRPMWRGSSCSLTLESRLWRRPLFSRRRPRAGDFH